MRIFHEGDFPVRPFLSSHLLTGSRTSLVIGPRGTGKTTLLIHGCKALPRSLYISADHPLVANISLWELGDLAFRSGYEGIAIDEIHHSADWPQHLKALYDSYPQKRIWASDSSSLQLRSAIADLSRRYPLVKMPLLSFREYLFMKEGLSLDPFNPLKEPEKAEEVVRQVNVLAHFKEYQKNGMRPIFIEGKYHERLLNIIEKTIFTDIPLLLPRVQDNYLRLMKSILGHLVTSSIPTLNIDNLCTKWSIGKDKLYELMNSLEHVRLLNIVRKENDNKTLNKGEKILLHDSSMYSALGGNIGNSREAYIVSMSLEAGMDIFASSNEQHADFILEGIPIEVGGKNKKPKSAQYVVRDDIDRPTGKAIPLWCFGFYY